MSAAVVFAGGVVTWPALFAALGVLTAVLLTMGFYANRGGQLRSLWLFFPAAVLFSLVLGRLFHWYSHPLLYSDFVTAMTYYRTGGFSLGGAAAGTLLAAALCRLAGQAESLPELLDALVPAGLGGLAVGRLGSAFDLSDRGRFSLADPELHRLPFSVWTETASGAGTWRFATFAAQALFCAGVFLVLVCLSRWLRRPGRRAAVGAILYAAGEIALDSTRYDADFFRFNGFIHVPQLLCLGVLLALTGAAAIRRLRGKKTRLRHVLGWALFLAGLGGAGYMEYFSQRRAERYALAYGVMAACLILAAAAALAITAPDEASPTEE